MPLWAQDGDAVIAFSFPMPAAPWSENDSVHWSKKSAHRRHWRTATRWWATKAERDGFFDGLEVPVPAVVTVVIPFPPKEASRRRDTHNYIGTVGKSVVDGLVDAGWWPDDTAEYVLDIRTRFDFAPKADVQVYVEEAEA